jgi:predicted nucleic acid-binding protein
VKLAVDTNRYSDFAKGIPDVVAALERAEALYLPFVVVAELRCGFVGGSRLRQNEVGLNRFLGRHNVHPLYADDQTTHCYAAIHEQLRRQGTPIPTNDLWIAALAVQHGLTLYARDAHFDHLPQIARL